MKPKARWDMGGCGKFAWGALLMLAACSPAKAQNSTNSTALNLSLLDARPAFQAMQQACKQQKAGAEICSALKRYSPETASAFFTELYTPSAIDQEGLLTGYYVPALQGSKTPSKEFAYPVWGLPADSSPKNAMPTRQQIEQGILAQTQKPLLWVNDRVDLFFLHIQGSGLVHLNDGTTLRLGFAGKNGHPYQSIGKLLVEEGEITKEKASMQSLKAWLRAHPQQVDRVLWSNPSYIFFRKLPDNAVLGGQNIPLTPYGSFAVDPTEIPYGTPIIVETVMPGNTQPQRIMAIAQDTGSAIKGKARADWFLGEGTRAEALAGELKQPARFWTLTLKRLEK